MKPGPAPKRSGEKLGKPNGKQEVIRKDAPPSGTRRRIPAPPPLPGWHPIAREWYRSLERSGQSIYYEPSDWMLAISTAESLSRYLKPRPVVSRDGEVTYYEQPMTGAEMAGILRAMGMLCVAESDRRRASIELVRPHASAEAEAQAEATVLTLVTDAFA
jgi:hypothetical protein